MDVRKLEGSIVALVTPFDEDGSINFAQLERLLEFQIENGTDAILTLGTTGESATMTDEEDNEVVKFVVEHVAGRVPVIAGSGSNCTATQTRKSLTYQKLGADALLIISPYYNKSNEEGIYRHLVHTAGTVDIPCIVHEMCRAYLDGDVARARELQVVGQPLIKALFGEVNPIPVKEALARMGLIEANYRLPLYPMSEAPKAALLDAMKGAGILG